MSSRQAKIESGGVQLFPFLAVLLCTMGALLVLLVVFGERAKNVAIAKKRAAAAPQAASDPGTAPHGISRLSAEEAARRLAELLRNEAKREELRRQAQSRAADEKERLTHLEEHERRLEHELAKMHFVLEQLEAAEQRQQVDQKTAEEEAQRLKELVAEAEAQVERIRTEGAGKKSYAILPYKGSSGTFRRPIYVECTADAVVIHPEGIRLGVEDFLNPMSSGTPLAAAIRAAQEELNARARAAGETEILDPYPLIVVRPDGITAHNLCKLIITSWGGEYGVEFIEQDWELEYPAPDPRLTQVMSHAVQQARERQALMARAAPRRYGEHVARNFGIGNGDGETSVGGASQYRLVPGGSGDGGAGSSFATGNRYGESGSPDSSGGTFAEQVSPGDSAAGGADGSAMAGTDQGAQGTGPAEAATANDASLAAGGAAPGGSAGMAKGELERGGAPSNGAAGSASSTGTTASSNGSASGPGGGGNAPSNLGSAVSIGSPESAADSAAKTRGSNWANEAARRRATPIARPIHAAVESDKLTLSADSTGGQDAGKPISFDQPTDGVLNELAAEIKRHMQEWGFAGQGMYWRPMLVFEVTPGAEKHAERLRDLLVDSGVDVRLERIARLPQVER